MAQMHHIIGSILRDIAQARVTSDLFSREVSKSYEQDSLLRLFPIPRSEIREMEIDLRFAVAEVGVDPERNDDRDAQLDRIIEQYSELISENIFENLGDSPKARKNEQWQQLLQSWNSENVKSELKTKILEYLDNNTKNLIDEKLDLNVTKARDGIKIVVSTVIYRQDKVKELDTDNLLSSVKSSVSAGLTEVLNSMDTALEFIQAAEEYKVEIDVTANSLQSLPEEAISSVKIKTVIRNYTWSQVEEKDGKPIRRLIPE
ncbi:MAG: hypothetical protein OEW67_06940 [Cyclobacteriaceae bacterium]|nr:hypothetical protein [Cyclobacteriaceae bacterium]